MGLEGVVSEGGNPSRPRPPGQSAGLERIQESESRRSWVPSLLRLRMALEQKGGLYLGSKPERNPRDYGYACA